MLYEKELGSLQDVIAESRILDIDGGIRATGRFKGRSCLVFITKSEEVFTVAVYNLKREGNEYVPDKRVLIKEVKGEQELESFLGDIVTKPVKASAY